jgi:hypothetical protein
MDHERVNIDTTRMSCGIMELSRMDDSDTDAVLYAVASRLYHPSRGQPCALALFSDIADGVPNSSTKLITRIRELGLGDTGCTPAVENPKTSNFITVWWWNIGHTAFKKWYSQRRVAKLAAVGN